MARADAVCVDPNFALSQMKYLDLERAEADAESPQAQLESDIAMLVPTYTALIQWLANAFGGMVAPKSTTTVDSEVLVQPFESISEV